MANSAPNPPLPKKIILVSRFLERRVTIELFLPVVAAPFHSVLLINDGQDLAGMPFTGILSTLQADGHLRGTACVGIHAGPERRREYGTAASADYLGRGNKAAAYARFITEELIPFLQSELTLADGVEWAFAGFSLGGLSALDIGWHCPQLFRTIGVFSGSLWWRSRDRADPDYRDELHRLMHAAIRAGKHVPGQRFFFECGTEDETEDRNNNGVIDSIDDTRDLIGELELLGHKDICYLEIEGGKHDVKTWARALPSFLLWAWGNAATEIIPEESKNAGYMK